ncbi:MAG: hypothetical protein QM760_05540 [Nibricoccus sp.]
MSSVAELSAPARERTKSLRAASGALDLRNVSKTYQVNKQPLQVLQDINLVVRPGEFVTLVGASGCR